ncbi:hypothetical protein C8J57DRAFT_1255321 [Mycena rebaudengoi]|nr:hypothetical protein C8J57DRAFT_1255321 [Mycena rebaudengoi]
MAESAPGAVGTASAYNPLVSPVYAQRAVDGVYQRVVEKLVAMRNLAMGNINYPADFQRVDLNWNDGTTFVDNTGREFRACIVGEIAGPLHGTAVRASGNFYTNGANFVPMNDTSKVKDVLALVMPTAATNELANYYDNQLVPLTDVFLKEAELDERNGKIFSSVRLWLKSLFETQYPDTIMIHMLNKYGVPAEAGAPGTSGTTPSPQKRVKRKLNDILPVKATGEHTLAVPAAEAAVPPSMCFITLCLVAAESLLEEEIKLGAYYDPHLLEDYGGPLYKHVKAKLVQHDIRDATNSNNDLIPPWEIYNCLKPGTLVLCNVSLHIFHFTDKGRTKKLYQLNVHSIKVLADSDYPIEKRHRWAPPGSEDLQEGSAGQEIFDSFSVATPVSAAAALTPPKVDSLSMSTGQDHDHEMDGTQGGAKDDGEGGRDKKSRKRVNGRVVHGDRFFATRDKTTCDGSDLFTFEDPRMYVDGDEEQRGNLTEFLPYLDSPTSPLWARHIYALMLACPEAASDAMRELWDEQIKVLHDIVAVDSMEAQLYFIVIQAPSRSL